MMDFLTGLFSQYRTPILIMGIGSVFLFIATPIIIPLVIRNMREEYFIRVSNFSLDRSPSRMSLYLLWHVLKNIMGLLFFLAGVVMLFVPGQGILTIIAGLALLDIPGKHRLINRLARGPRVRSALNWIRRKTRKPDFIFHVDGGEGETSVEEK